MKSVNVKVSYTAADIIPIKLLLDKDVMSDSDRIPPVHIQLMPTNKCNMNCKFCSCSERNKSQELDWEKCKKIIDLCKLQGTKSVTITGGGEPLLYPNFVELIDHLHERNIKIGLVTNGLLLSKFDKETYSKVTWCRISNDDSRNFSKDYKEILAKVVLDNPSVDWAFSHVITSRPNLNEMIKVIEFANEYDFTHVRLVADLFEPEKIDMEEIHRQISTEVNDRLVIYQGRKSYTKGDDCYICYLKPVIAADGKVYTCCGAQYALPAATKDMPVKLCLGDALNIATIISKSNKPFDGSKCFKCYYSSYNHILKNRLSNIKHKEFV